MKKILKLKLHQQVWSPFQDLKLILDIINKESGYQSVGFIQQRIFIIFEMTNFYAIPHR